MKVMFSVPDNVFVLGTMNTADRSLTALDTALRRRFEFIEMMPDPNVLLGRKVADINLSRLLATINNRIEILYDREHMMGHAYFISVRTLEDLAQCFINKVIPLLQEYFFDDYEKICWVLGRASDPRKCDFIAPRKRNSFQMKFNLPDVYDIVTDHRVFMNPETYIQIYKGADI
jgi:5-methylcytosine-specific restriction protein B